MKSILARLLRAAADRLAGPIMPTPNPNLGGLFDTTTVPGHAIYTGPTLETRCPRCGRQFWGTTHACYTVDYSSTAVGTN